VKRTRRSRLLRSYRVVILLPYSCTRGCNGDVSTVPYAHTTHTHVCARLQGMRCAHAARTEPATTRRKSIFARASRGASPEASRGRISRPKQAQQTSTSGLLSGCPNHVGTAAERLHGSDCKISACGAAFWHTHTTATASSARGAHRVMMIPIKRRRRQPSNLAGGGGGDGDPCCTYMAHERCTQRA
jgi:hypothetical protein